MTTNKSRVGPREADGRRFQRVLPAVLLIGAVGALVISVPAAGGSGHVGVVDSTSTPDVASTSVPETGEPATSEPVATDTATTEPAITDPGTTEPGVTDPSPSLPVTSEPIAVSSTPDETSVDTVVETSEPATTIEAAPVVVLLMPSMSLFPDADGNFTNDDDEIAYAGESSGVTASVTVVNAAPDPLGAISIAAPNGASPGEWGKLDVDTARVLLPTGVTARILITFDDGSTVTENVTSSGPIPISTGGSPVASLVVTFHGSLDPGARVGLDVHGTLNDGVGDDDLPGGRSPGIGACASIGGGALDDADVPFGDVCGVVSLQEPDGGFGVLAAVLASWTATGANPSWTGTSEIPAAGFPAATFTTNSNTPTIPSGASAFLNASTPFGTAFESTQNQPYLSLRAAAGGLPSTTTFTFATPTQVGWGFSVGDIDADLVTIAASGPSGPLTGAQLGFEGSFNYCSSPPVPPSCDSPPFGDLPTWNPATSTVVGNVLDTDGAAAWFRPTVPITTLTLTFAVQSGIPIYQLWFAAPTSNIGGTVTEATPTGPEPAPPGTLVQLDTPDGDPVLDNSGNPVQTPTAADGTFAFTDVVSGPNIIEVIPPSGYGPIQPSAIAVDSTNGDVSGIEFVVQVLPAGASTTTTTVTPPGGQTTTTTSTTPVGQTTTTTSTTPVGPPTTIPIGTLPVTGADPSTTAVLAIGLVIAGALICGPRRRLR